MVVVTAKVRKWQWIFQVGWLRASDQTILSVHTRTVTHNARISVSYETSGCSGSGAASGNAFGVTGSSQATEEVVNGTWRLHIRQLKESDRDCYMCQINTSPMISELGCLDILGKNCLYSIQSNSSLFWLTSYGFPYRTFIIWIHCSNIETFFHPNILLFEQNVC